MLKIRSNTFTLVTGRRGKDKSGEKEVMDGKIGIRGWGGEIGKERRGSYGNVGSVTDLARELVKMTAGGASIVSRRHRCASSRRSSLAYGGARR